MIPLWAVLGLSAAIISTAIPLIQERMKGDGFAIALWVKVAVVVLSAPLAFYFGMPEDPKFYLTLSLTALLWCVSDVIYFRAVPLAGAGVVSRLLPSAVLISFILWFFVDPALLDKYIANPLISSCIVGVLLLATLFAVLVKRDPVSWAGVRVVWFVIFAACVGPIIEKLSLGYAPARQAPYAFMFCQGSMMIAFWAVYYALKKPLPLPVLFSLPQIKTGLSIGVVGFIVLTLKTIALVKVEQPAYLSVILFTDALWIILYYRLTGRQETSNIWAGLGIVACAIALVMLKQAA
jgi:hypothetical protein